MRKRDNSLSMLKPDWSSASAIEMSSGCSELRTLLDGIDDLGWSGDTLVREVLEEESQALWMEEKHEDVRRDSRAC